MNAAIFAVQTTQFWTLFRLASSSIFETQSRWHSEQSDEFFTMPSASERQLSLFSSASPHLHSKEVSSSVYSNNFTVSKTLRSWLKKIEWLELFSKEDIFRRGFRQILVKVRIWQLNLFEFCRRGFTDWLYLGDEKSRQTLDACEAQIRRKCWRVMSHQMFVQTSKWILDCVVL